MGSMVLLPHMVPEQELPGFTVGPEYFESYCDQAIYKFCTQPAVVKDVLVESVGFEVVAVVDDVDTEVVGTAVDPVLH